MRLLVVSSMRLSFDRNLSLLMQSLLFSMQLQHFNKQQTYPMIERMRGAQPSGNFWQVEAVLYS